VPDTHVNRLTLAPDSLHRSTAAAAGGAWPGAQVAAIAAMLPRDCLAESGIIRLGYWGATARGE